MKVVKTECLPNDSVNDFGPTHIVIRSVKYSGSSAFYYLYDVNKKKQPPEMFCKTRCSLKFWEIHRKHLCESIFFNENTGLRHWCFPVTISKFIRRPFCLWRPGRKPEVFLNTINCAKEELLGTILMLFFFNTNAPERNAFNQVK